MAQPFVRLADVRSILGTGWERTGEETRKRGAPTGLRPTRRAPPLSLYGPGPSSHQVAVTSGGRRPASWISARDRNRARGRAGSPADRPAAGLPPGRGAVGRGAGPCSWAAPGDGIGPRDGREFPGAPNQSGNRSRLSAVPGPPATPRGWRDRARARVPGPSRTGRLAPGPASSPSPGTRRAPARLAARPVPAPGRREAESPAEAFRFEEATETRRGGGALPEARAERRRRPGVRSGPLQNSGRGTRRTPRSQTARRWLSRS
jgi:hypothetical protein